MNYAYIHISTDLQNIANQKHEKIMSKIKLVN